MADIIQEQLTGDRLRQAGQRALEEDVVDVGERTFQARQEAQQVVAVEMAAGRVPLPGVADLGLDLGEDGLPGGVGDPVRADLGFDARPVDGPGLLISPTRRWKLCFPTWPGRWRRP